jgi:uncharacterized protein YfbU (UPF0304 family)
MEAETTIKGNRIISFACYLRHLSDDDMMLYLKYTTREHGDFFPMFMGQSKKFSDWFSSGFPFSKSAEGLNYWKNRQRQYELKFGFIEIVNN